MVNNAAYPGGSGNAQGSSSVGVLPAPKPTYEIFSELIHYARVLEGVESPKEWLSSRKEARLDKDFGLSLTYYHLAMETACTFGVVDVRLVEGRETYAYNGSYAAELRRQNKMQYSQFTEQEIINLQAKMDELEKKKFESVESGLEATLAQL